MLGNNQAMYEAVLPWLATQGVPFLFASSSQAAANSTVLGRAKLAGEERVHASCPKGKEGRRVLAPLSCLRP